MKEEYKVINYGIPELADFNNPIIKAIETITLCKETYTILHENKGQLSERQFENIKREVAMRLSTQFLERMSFSIIDEECNRFITYKFSNNVLIEKERLELWQRIDKLKLDLDNSKEEEKRKYYKQISNLKDDTTKLLHEVTQYKNATLWQRIKYLLKGEI